MSAHPSPNKRSLNGGITFPSNVVGDGPFTHAMVGLGGGGVAGASSVTGSSINQSTSLLPGTKMRLDYHVPMTIATSGPTSLVPNGADAFSRSSGGDSVSSPETSGGGGVAMDEEEIPVGVDGRVKVLTGVTKRTTCDDIIYALLLQNDLVPSATPADAGLSVEEGGSGGGTPRQAEVERWTLVERWRDVERPLQGKTKILKVWRAWGSEQSHVTFQLRSRSANNAALAKNSGSMGAAATTTLASGAAAPLNGGIETTFPPLKGTPLVDVQCPGVDVGRFGPGEPISSPPRLDDQCRLPRMRGGARR